MSNPKDVCVGQGLLQNENAHTAFIKWHCSKVIWNAMCTKIHVHVQVLDFNGSLTAVELTHWGRVTHICVSKLTIIIGRRQAIIWTNAGILLTRTLGTNFSEILSKIRVLSFKKMELKMSSAKWRRFCLGLNVLRGRTSNYVPLFMLV